MKYTVTLLLLTFYFCTNAQKPTGKASAILQAPLLKSTGNVQLANQWNIAMNLEFAKGHGVPNAANFYKQKQINAKQQNQSTIATIKKTRANAPILGTNFLGNKTEFLTPTDNGVAISNGGKIVSVDNCTIEYHNEDGTPILQLATWNDFLDNDTTLKLLKYDPRVVYDNVHDRFIAMILHGPLSKTNNKILIAYSKTNNPADGWNIYAINGNPYNDSSFSDYPNIGITNNELFINLNLFKYTAPYKYNQSVIFQVSLSNGYAGAANLNYKVWGDSISTPTGLPGFTIVPAQNGMGQSNGPNMWFVSNWPDGDSNVYAYQITKELFDTTSQLLQYSFPTPKFTVCANGFIKNPTSGVIDSISTGSSVVQSAFILDNTIHYTFDADFNNGWCGINYGRINLSTATAQVTQAGISGTYLCYPTIAHFGKTASDKKVVIAYLQADTNTLPQTCAIVADELMNFSLPIVVKKGDTIVDILKASTNPGLAERWGDYTGIHRKYMNASGELEVWMAGAYGANNARPASYNTWIAQLLATPIFPLSTSNLNSKENQMQVYPNPVVNMFTTSFDNAATGMVDIYITDMLGKKVMVLYNGEMPAGKCNFQFNKGMLSKGIYFLQVYSNETLQTQKLEVL
jgi:hypothetical protein